MDQGKLSRPAPPWPASIVADAFEVNPGLGTPTAQAWLATIRRT